MNELWKRLCDKFPRVPAEFEFAEGDVTANPYQHSTSILGLSFSPDDKLIAAAGGGCIPGVDGSIRLIDSSTLRNVQTLHGHVCGVHDVSFDPQTGLLASASFDYGVHLWNLSEQDVIFLVGADDKTKGYARFARQGSLLAVGEYAYYEGPHSVYVYDLNRQRVALDYALPDDRGVTAMAISPDSRNLAISAEPQDQSEAAVVLVIDLQSFKVVNKFTVDEFKFFDLAFVSNPTRLLAGVMGGAFGDDSGLIVLHSKSGEIDWSTRLGGIGINLAHHPTRDEVAVAFESDELHLYETATWSLRRRIKRAKPDTHICSLAYSNAGTLIAYGLSNGVVNVVNTVDGG